MSRRRCLQWGLAAAAWGLAALPAHAQQSTAPAAPVANIVLERAEILAGETVPVRVFFTDAANAGPDAPSVRRLCVQLLGPAFLALSGPAPERSGPPCRATTPSALGPFDADTPLTFLLTAADKNLREGKVTVAFNLAFDAAGPRRVMVEKTLDVGVFGIGSISGVPLQLAVLVLPGLAALGLARLLGVQWAAAMQTVEQAAVGLGISFALAALADRLSARIGLPEATSVERVLLLVALGFVLGGVFWLFSRAAQARERVRLAQAVLGAFIQPEDDFAHAVVKALRLNADRLEPTQVSVVRTRAGRQLIGSLTARTPDGGVAILGWGKVQVAEAGLRRDLSQVLAEEKWRGLADRLAGALASRRADMATLERVRVYDDQQQVLEGERAAVVRIAAADYLSLEQRGNKGTETGQSPVREIVDRPR